MAIEEVQIRPEVPIFFKGEFDLEPLYRTCIEWMREQKVEFIYEKKYKDKEAGPGIRDIEIGLLGDVKLDEFRKWNISITISAWDTKTLDKVAKSGHKVLSGRMEMKFGSGMEIDYQDAYGSDSLIVSNMRKIIKKVWSRGNPGRELATMEGKLQELASKCQKLLELEIT